MLPLSRLCPLPRTHFPQTPTYISNSFPPLVKVLFSVGPTIIFLNSQPILFLYFFFSGKLGVRPRALQMPGGHLMDLYPQPQPCCHPALSSHIAFTLLVGWLSSIIPPHRSTSSIRQRLIVVLASVSKCWVCFRDMYAHTHCMSIEVDDSSGCWDW